MADPSQHVPHRKPILNIRTEPIEIQTSEFEKRFFTKVRTFFKLMDANNNGTLERADARARLREVLLDPSSGMSPRLARRRRRSQSQAEVEEAEEEVNKEVEAKVDGLFAAADIDHDEHITCEEFEAMYRHLLKDVHMEPELLELDLDRAIHTLEIEHPEANLAPPADDE